MDTDFPYDAVVAEFQRVGKHFVRPAILAALAGRTGDRFALSSRRSSTSRSTSTTGATTTRATSPSTCSRCPARAPSSTGWSRSSSPTCSGTSSTHGDDERLVAKRCRLGLRVLRRGDDPRRGVRGGRARVRRRRGRARAAPDRAARLARARRVHVHPDAAVLRGDVRVHRGQAARGDRRARDRGGGDRRTAEQAMLAARPLWSMVATMRPQHFLAFREFTDGASAIQSRNYKLVESLCARPSDGAARLAGLPVGAGGARARAGRPAFARRRRARRRRARGDGTGSNPRSPTGATATTSWR